LEWAFYVGGRYGVGDQEWTAVRIEQFPHLRVDYACLLKPPVFLVSLNRDSQVGLEAAINLSGRKPRARQKNLRPNHPRSHGSRPDRIRGRELYIGGNLTFGDLRANARCCQNQTSDHHIP
jgi:hypothetical protein